MVAGKSDIHRFAIESYGVRIGINANTAAAIGRFRVAIATYLPGVFQEISDAMTPHEFDFHWNRDDKDTLLKNGELIFERFHRSESIESAASHVRLAVAEFAVGHVFVHAGVVARSGRAVILPGKSFQGKTALTAELVRRGSLYYSDEFAIIGAEGLVHPFPKALSVRGEIDPYRQIDHPADEFGATGTSQLPIGLVLFCRYKPDALWRPRILTAAQGVIETMKDTVPVRRDPQFTLSVLGKVGENAVFAKSSRPDLDGVAAKIVDFIDSQLLQR